MAEGIEWPQSEERLRFIDRWQWAQGGRTGLLVQLGIGTNTTVLISPYQPAMSMGELREYDSSALKRQALHNHISMRLAGLASQFADELVCATDTYVVLRGRATGRLLAYRWKEHEDG